MPSRLIATSLRSMLLFFLLAGSAVKSDELTLAVALGLSQQQAAQTYQPLIAYLAQATGRDIRLETSVNILAHWQLMRREAYDIVIDAPPFTAYRAARMDYAVVAKLPDVLSFTLASHVDFGILDPSELIGRRVASQPSPALGALGLINLFPDSVRQPHIVPVDTHVEAAQSAVDKRTVGAMLPTSLMANFPDLVPVYTTEQLPAPGISVSSRVSPDQRERIRQALLNAQNSPTGRAMLEALNVPNLEEAANDTYLGLETMLEGVWGY
ncbi:phosphate/phosphite/phosphonate ABC transporter substrate-binding protein [Thioalkalivibrio sulfidiphilus]|uniref:phosphate/phosphite/phosphonate ABC transporter substrate-binding protein n=1 Tax=Thioalkalivibrio sulfidiphilus TaxID=1033854 RepID=UPI003B385E0C